MTDTTAMSPAIQQDKHMFWDLELATTPSPSETTLTILRHLDNPTEDVQERSDTVRIILALFDRIDFKPIQKSSILEQTIRYIGTARSNTKSLLLANRLRETQDIAPSALELLAELDLRHGFPANSTETSVSNEVHARRLLLEGHGIRVVREQIADSHWKKLIVAVVTQRLRKIALLGLNKLGPEFALYVWLLHTAIPNRSTIDRIAKPNHVKKKSYGLQLHHDLSALITACVSLSKLEQKYSSSDLLSLAANTDRFATREGEILFLGASYQIAHSAADYETSDSVYRLYKSVVGLGGKGFDLLGLRTESNEPANLQLSSNRIHRAWRASKIGAQLSISVIRTQLPKLISGNFDRATLAAVISSLGVEASELRGGMAKFNQLVSGIPGMLPPDFIASLEEPNTIRSRMPRETLEKLFNEQSGLTLETQFDSFEFLPFAMGSIGQLHRARIGDKDFCLKFRYPSISAVIDADFKNLLAVVPLLKILFPGLEIRDLVAQWHEHTKNETDFAKELQNLTRAYPIMSEVGVRIPKVEKRLCNQNVITMEYIVGQRLEDFARMASQEEKDYIGGKIVESHFQFIANGTYRNDIHIGNYLVDEHGELVLVDIANLLSEQQIEALNQHELVKACLEGDAKKLQSVLKETGWSGFSKVAPADWLSFAAVFMQPFVEPVFQFNKEFIETMWNTILESSVKKVRLPGTSAPTLRFVISFFGILMRLNAKVEFRKFAETFCKSHR